MGIPEKTLKRVPVWTMGDRLRKARTSAGLEQRQLALLVGLSTAEVVAAERDRCTPSATELGLWAAVTSVPAAWLTGDLSRSSWGVVA